MFTGLVEDTATVKKITEAGEGVRMVLNSDIFEDLERGESIDVSGACLTVEDFETGEATFFLAEETLNRTWFSELEEGDVLNVERSLTPTDRMGGHIVQGHADGVAEIVDIVELEEGWNFHFSKPDSMSNYVVEKGFITIEGISLTVTEVDDESFAVTIIPETWKVTNLSEKTVGDLVNIEADVTAKYVERIMQNRE